MSQTSKKPQEGQKDSGEVNSYEDIKRQMMEKLETANSLASDETPATEEQTEVSSAEKLETSVASNVVETQADATAKPATVGGPAEETEDEVTVEDYMNKLLNRSSAMKQPDQPTPQKATPKVQESSSKELLEENFAGDVETHKKALEPVKLTKASLPELEASFLNEMRSVSRQSAEFAISDCEKRRYKSLASVQLGIGATLIGFGVLQTMVAPTWANTALVSMPCYAVAVYFFYRYTRWRNLTRIKPEPKTLDPEPAQPNPVAT